MKSILIGLLLILWTHSFQCFSQTDSVYCLAISKARLLVADAIRLRLVDSVLHNRHTRIELLENEKKSAYDAFTNLLKIEQDKFKEQSLIISDLQKHSQSFADQLAYIEKREKKQRTQNKILKVGITLAAGFIVYQSIR